MISLSTVKCTYSNGHLYLLHLPLVDCRGVTKDREEVGKTLSELLIVLSVRRHVDHNHALKNLCGVSSGSSRAMSANGLLDSL
jgi:hypothetical protein